MSQGGHHGIAHWAGLRCVPLIDSTITWSGQQRAQDAQVLEDHSCLSAAFAAHRRRCSATCTQQAIGLVVSRVSHRCGPRCHWYRLQSARSSNQPGEAPERSAGPPSRDRRQVRYSRSFLCPKGLITSHGLARELTHEISRCLPKLRDRSVNGRAHPARTA